MRYRVNTTCQFRNRLYEKDEVVDLPAEVEVPPYFDALEEVAPPAQDTPNEGDVNDDTPPAQEIPTTAKRGRKK